MDGMRKGLHSDSRAEHFRRILRVAGKVEISEYRDRAHIKMRDAGARGREAVYICIEY